MTLKQFKFITYLHYILYKFLNHKKSILKILSNNFKYKNFLYNIFNVIMILDINLNDYNSI